MGVGKSSWIMPNSSKHYPEGHPTMKVTIIGAGNVGKALGTSISRAGHDVTITAKHPEHAQGARVLRMEDRGHQSRVSSSRVQR